MKTTDVFTPQQRSRIMARIKSRDTKPELKVRRLAHALGYRFRLQRKDLPGTPDLAFPGRKKVIFVHGCFWHGHDCPRGARRPKQNADYWIAKIARNHTRDADTLTALAAMGWSALTIWECEMADPQTLERRIKGFLDTP